MSLSTIACLISAFLIYQLLAHSLPIAVASCAVIGGAMGTFDAAGSLAGERRERDSPETMEERRKRFFKQKPSLSQPVES